MTTQPAATEAPDLRPLIAFSAVALPVGWVLLSIPLVVDVPLAPFILGTLYLGLVAPAVVLTRRESRAGVRTLLRDTVRPPRPAWLLAPSALLVPGAVATVATVLGAGTEVSGSFLVTLAFSNVLSSLLVVNLWEEMAWAGFVQRRATTRWGYLRGSIVTALLFTAVHLPLSLQGADGADEVAYNVAAMVVSGVGLRLLIGAFDTWGRGSILALGLLHATFNASSELVDADHDWIRYIVTLALGLAAAALLVGRQRVGHHEPTAAAHQVSGSDAR